MLTFSSLLVGRTTLPPTLIALRSKRRIDQQAATFQLPVGHPSVKPVVYLAYAHALLASSCGCAYAQLLHPAVEQTDRQTSSYLSAAGRSSLGQTSSQPCICPCHVGEFLQLELAHNFSAALAQTALHHFSALQSTLSWSSPHLCSHSVGNTPQQRGLKMALMCFTLSKMLHASVRLTHRDRAHDVMDRNVCALESITRRSVALARAVNSFSSGHFTVANAHAAQNWRGPAFA